MTVIFCSDFSRLCLSLKPVNISLSVLFSAACLNFTPTLQLASTNPPTHTQNKNSLVGHGIVHDTSLVDGVVQFFVFVLTFLEQH